MFAGIVTSIGEVRSVKPRAGNLHRLTISCDYPRAGIVQGASIACSGVCLTVVEGGEEDGRTWFAVEAGDETLRVTTASRWRAGTRVNLERALKFGDELGGHLVSGHVDGIGEALSSTPASGSARWVFRVPVALSRFIAVKGSVAVD
ncbi:MAG: riboflavin synthase, partial [Pseudolabrys sp.]